MDVKRRVLVLKVIDKLEKRPEVKEEINVDVVVHNSKNKKSLLKL